MPTKYIAKITRPNLETISLGESLENHLKFNTEVSNLKPMENFFTVLPGFIELSIKPFISWKEIYNRKNELRPDILYWINSIGIDNILTNPEKYNIGPGYNPFSLIWNYNLTFDSKENVLSALEIIDFVKLKKEIDKLNNTVIYEELEVDGIIDASFKKKLL